MKDIAEKSVDRKREHEETGVESEAFSADSEEGKGRGLEGLPAVNLGSFDRPSLALVKMCDLFRAYTGLDLLLYSPDLAGNNWKDKVVARSKWKEKVLAGTAAIPRYCRLIQSTPGGRMRCKDSHDRMLQEMQSRGEGGSRRCHAGLTIVCHPIWVEGEGLTALHTVCGRERMSLSQEFPNLYREIASLGLSKELMLEAAESLPIISPSDMHMLTEWLKLFAFYLSEASEHQVDGVKLEAEKKDSGKVEWDKDSLMYHVRHAVEPYIVLPPPEENRNCGCTELVIQRVRSYVDECYNLPLSSQITARALGFEPSYFGKAFKRYMGVSLARFLLRTRLNNAKDLLRSPHLSNSEIARCTGLGDSSNFARTFRRIFGISPSEYRKLTKDWS
ncbi:helix-turn-helix domain-containing protein [Candidatus Hydrogenedentota bacterium]